MHYNIVILLWLFFCYTVVAQRNYSVVVKPIAPFVMIDDSKFGDERYEGFSIDLWREIAKKNDFVFHFVEAEPSSVGQLIDDVANNVYQIGIAAITITSEREEHIDFTHSMYQSGLRILIPKNSTSSNVLSLIFNQTIFLSICWMFLLILFGGHFIWLFERNTNPEFPKRYLAGIWQGIWWAAVTVTTVGYGDKIPTSKPGRIFGFVWMFSGLIVVGFFTGSISSGLILEASQGTITGPSDLKLKSVATLPTTTAEIYGNELGAKFSLVDTIEEAYKLLMTSQVDAVLYDVPGLFEQQNYGIIVGEGDPLQLREPINRALLEFEYDGGYKQLLNSWLSDEKLTASEVVTDVGETGLTLWEILLVAFTISVVSFYTKRKQKFSKNPPPVEMQETNTDSKLEKLNGLENSPEIQSILIQLKDLNSKIDKIVEIQK